MGGSVSAGRTSAPPAGSRVSVVIRPERTADAVAIHEVNRLAFGRAAEADLVDALRGTAHWIPELSLVADEAGTVVGHVLLTRVTVREGDAAAPALALAPVAVRPGRQGASIGSRLIREAMERARDLGHGVVILLGHPAYYPRFGFVRASLHGIRYPGPVPEDAFLVAELSPGALAGVRGVVEYAAAFSEL